MIGSLNFDPLYAFHAKKSLKTNIANENTIRTIQTIQKEAKPKRVKIAENENRPSNIKTIITKNATIETTVETTITAISNTIAWAAWYFT